MFSIIIPVIDPFDRLVDAGAIQGAITKVLHLKGDYEIIIINNNETALCPQLTGYLRSLGSSLGNKVKIVEPEKNMGTARGFNAGLKVAQADSPYLVFMSSDADIVDPLMLSKIKQVMEDHPVIGIAHPISVFEDSDEFNFSSQFGRRVLRHLIRKHSSPALGDISGDEIDRILESVATKSGVSMPLSKTPLTFAVYRRKMMEDIGSFDEGVEFGCYETDDIGYRALLSGYQVARLNGIFVNHRRLYIRNLVVGTHEFALAPHSDVILQSKDWWHKKWRRPYKELYARWRYGRFIFSIILPYFWLRKLGGRLKDRGVRYRGLLP